MKTFFMYVMLVLLVVSGVYAQTGFSGKALYEGNIIETGDLTVSIYDYPVGGVLLYSEFFPGAVRNGYFDVELNPSSLIYGKTYYLDIAINGNDLNFDANDRKEVVWWQGKIQDLDESLTIHTNSISPSLTVQQENNATTLSVKGTTTAADIAVIEVTGSPGNGYGYGGAALGFFKRSSNDQVRLGVNPLTATYGYGSSTFYRNLNSSATAIPVVLIQQDNTNDDQPAFRIRQAGTSYALRATLTADADTTALLAEDASKGFGKNYVEGPRGTDTNRRTWYIYRNLPTENTGVPVAEIYQDNVNDDQTALWINQKGNANALIANKYLDTAEATGQFRDQSLGNNLNRAVFAMGDNGYRKAGYFYRNLGSDYTGAPVVDIVQDNSGDDQAALRIVQSGNGHGISIDSRDGGRPINAVGNIRSYMYNMDPSANGEDSPTLYLQGASVDPSMQGILKVQHNGGFGVKLQSWYDSSEEIGSFDIDGDLQIDGSISKAGGSFTIDHPLDPSNKILQHSFVESPEMRNMYFGQAKTGNDKKATVALPSWWQALNGYDTSEYTYQITSIGKFCSFYISEEISDNKFVVTSDQSQCKFSWQVSGIRHDAWAESHRIPVEMEKVPANLSVGFILEQEFVETENETVVRTYRVPVMPSISSQRKGSCIHDEACDSVSSDVLIPYPETPQKELVDTMVVKKS
ncbi:hypothetical protein HYW21_05635 [Candidatus Woesearchaeota archaeon]|nr:hypothetical protein [Candidatus Woesearchaeota archaeon]